MVGVRAPRRRFEGSACSRRRRPAQAARPADLAAGLARRLGRHRRKLGGARGFGPSRRGRAADRGSRRAKRRRAGSRRKAIPGFAERKHAHRDRPRGKPGRRARLVARQSRIRQEMRMISRRSFIAAGSAAGTLATLGFPRMAFARANTPRRFIFVIQRGAADGLNIVAPTGDPAYAGLRGDFAQDLAAGTRLGSFFTLHPALAEAAKMYADKQALFVHAVASPYRDRSHFDGQNVLETGGSAAYRLHDGWMNRLLGLLPADAAKALALSTTVPMALRGSHEVSSYAQSQLPSPTDDLLTRVSALYASDQQLHGLWSAAMDTRMKAGDPMQGGGGQNGAAIGALAAKMLAGDGARIAMIETNGWDTHSAQRGRLNAQLRSLDQLVAALKTGLGPEWATT